MGTLKSTLIEKHDRLDTISPRVNDAKNDVACDYSKRSSNCWIRDRGEKRMIVFDVEPMRLE